MQKPIRSMLQLAAAVPPDLHAADEVLSKYGRWAAGLSSRARTCGSAEGDYRPGGEGAREARTTAFSSPLLQSQRLAAQRALTAIDTVQREVLVALYVPGRQPPIARLRMAGIDPRRINVPALHLQGLRAWWARYLEAEA